MLDLAILYRDWGRFQESEQLLLQTQEALRQAPESHPLEEASVLRLLGLLELGQQRLEQADVHMQQAMEIKKRILPPGHRDIAIGLADLARVAVARGDTRTAEARLREALATAQQSGESGSGEDLTEARLLLGELLERQSRSREAEEVYRQALQVLREAAVPDRDYRNGQSIGHLRRILESEGHADEALSLYRDFMDRTTRLPQAVLDGKVRLAPEALAEEQYAVLVRRGDVAARRSDLQEAAAAYREAHTLRPQDIDLINHLAVVLATIGAEDEFQRLISDSLARNLASTNNGDIDGLVFATIARPTTDAQNAVLDRLVRQMDPKGKTPSNRLVIEAAVALRRGDWARAELLASEAVAHGPSQEDWVRARIIRSAALSRLGRSGEATRLLAECRPILRQALTPDVGGFTWDHFCPWFLSRLLWKEFFPGTWDSLHPQVNPAVNDFRLVAPRPPLTFSTNRAVSIPTRPWPQSESPPPQPLPPLAMLRRLAEAAWQSGDTNGVRSKVARYVQELDRIVATNPTDTDKTKHLALARLWSGQTNEYVAECRKLLELAVSSTDPTTQDRAAKACLVSPGLEPGMVKQAVTAGRQAAKLAAKSDGNLSWFLTTAALADLRDGKAAEAEAELNEILERPNEVQDRKRLAHACRSLVRANLGRTREALADLTAVEQSLPKFPGRPALSPLLFEPDLIAAQLLHDEAKELLTKSSASPGLMPGWGVAANGQSAKTSEPAGVYDAYQLRAGSTIMDRGRDTNLVVVAFPAGSMPMSFNGLDTTHVAVITHTNGTVVALQFTQISGINVTYRWRSRVGASAPVEQGQSSFSEPFQPPPPPSNCPVVVFRLPVQDLRTFPAGGLRIVWEPEPVNAKGQRNPGTVRLLYSPQCARLNIVDGVSEPFDTLPRTDTPPYLRPPKALQTNDRGNPTSRVRAVPTRKPDPAE